MDSNWSVAVPAVLLAVGGGLVWWHQPRRFELVDDQALRVHYARRTVEIPLGDVACLRYSAWSRRYHLYGGGRRIEFGRMRTELDVRALARGIRRAAPDAVLDPDLLAPVPRPEPVDQSARQRLHPVSAPGGRLLCPSCGHGIAFHPQPWRAGLTSCARCLLDRRQGAQSAGDVCRERYEH